MRHFSVFLFLALIGSAGGVLAYPNFIGYGYTTCVTCHYNSLGHGPLNDYGRALFAQEIAARPFVDPSVGDEVLADRSGFIPGKEMPAWIRPGIKYRGLWFQTSPGGAQSIQKYFHMQREVNLAVQSDEMGTWRAVFTWNLLPAPRDLFGKCGGEPCETSYFREMYLQHRWNRNLTLEAGLMEKAYGLRVVDHTAVSRAPIRVGPYDQTHGFMAHWFEAAWDVAVQLQFGHQSRPADQRERGVSITGEYEVAEKHRLGASISRSETPSFRWWRAGVHGRMGLSHSPGSSLMWELGTMEDVTKATATRAAGMYGLGEFTILLTRGYNLLSTVERIQTRIDSAVPEVNRWSLGFLTFPMQRTEARFMLIQTKTYSTTAAAADSNQVQGQFHVSW